MPYKIRTYDLAKLYTLNIYSEYIEGEILNQINSSESSYILSFEPVNLMILPAINPPTRARPTVKRIPIICAFATSGTTKTAIIPTSVLNLYQKAAV